MERPLSTDPKPYIQPGVLMRYGRLGMVASCAQCGGL